MEDKVQDLEFCEHCIIQNSHKVSFSKGTHTSKGDLNYFHLDLQGPTRTQFKGG